MYARCNTAEAAQRKFSVKSLWRSSGRATEPAFLSYEGLKWNKKFKLVVSESPQTKVSKTKLSAFCAGATRHSDWLIDFADVLVFDRGFTTYEPDCKTWIHKDLQGGEGLPPPTLPFAHARKSMPLPSFCAPQRLQRVKPPKTAQVFYLRLTSRGA